MDGFEEFEASLARATQRWTKRGRILELILYGPYAHGDRVGDPASGHTSHDDILVVVNDERLTNLVDWLLGHLIGLQNRIFDGYFWSTVVKRLY